MMTESWMRPGLSLSRWPQASEFCTYALSFCSTVSELRQALSNGTLKVFKIRVNDAVP